MLDALNQVTVAGANGDQRGFNERNHEGVVDDDVYFATFQGMTYKPVKDDPLSADARPHRAAALSRRSLRRRSARLRSRSGCGAARDGFAPWPPRGAAADAAARAAGAPARCRSTALLPARVEPGARRSSGSTRTARRTRSRSSRRSPLKRLGDYVFAIPAPVRLGAPRAGHRVAAGTADEPDPLAGLLARQRMLSVDGRASRRGERADLPVKVRVEPRDGRTTVLIENQTGVTAPSYTGDVEPIEPDAGSRAHPDGDRAQPLRRGAERRAARPQDARSRSRSRRRSA